MRPRLVAIADGEPKSFQLKEATAIGYDFPGRPLKRNAYDQGSFFSNVLSI